MLAILFAAQGLIACNLAIVIMLIICTMSIFRIPKASWNQKRATRKNPRMVKPSSTKFFLLDDVALQRVTQTQLKNRLGVEERALLLNPFKRTDALSFLIY